MMSNAVAPSIPALEELSGKRFALLGFDSSSSSAVASVLEQAGAFCRNIPADSSCAAAVARSFDGAVVHLSAELETDLKFLSSAGKPILAVAPHALLGHQIGYIRSYATDCVAYPCSNEELLLRASCMAAVPMPGKTQDAGSPIALIADDDPSIRALVRATLNARRIECHVAEDGATALRIAREIRPSVLLLDVNMPQFDGFEVLSAIRNEGATAGIRILMLTGREQENDIVRAFGLGADDYLVKPFNPMELTVRVQRLLRVSR